MGIIIAYRERASRGACFLDLGNIFFFFLVYVDDSRSPTPTATTCATTARASASWWFRGGSTGGCSIAATMTTSSHRCGRRCGHRCGGTANSMEIAGRCRWDGTRKASEVQPPALPSATGFPLAPPSIGPVDAESAVGTNGRDYGIHVRRSASALNVGLVLADGGQAPLDGLGVEIEGLQATSGGGSVPPVDPCCENKLKPA